MGNNIKKTFDSFINEELNKDTYLSAADKLKQLGHGKRAEDMKTYVKDKDEKATITFNDVEFEMNESDIQIDDKYDTLNITLTDITKPKNKRLISIDFHTEIVNVVGIDGIKDRKDANTLYKFIKVVIEKNVDKHPKVEELLTKLKVNNLYK